MVDRWHDPDFANAWDSSVAVGNPTRAEHLDILLAVLSGYYRPGATILDLGIGSGQVEELLFERLPDARVVGVDGSAAMLALARQRLQPVADRCTFIQHDFADIDALRLPAPAYPIVISVQALHHAPHEQQRAVVHFAHDVLEAGGLFLLMERIMIDAARLPAVYAALWERLERVSDVKSGWDPARYLQRLRDKEDHVVALEEHLGWLRAAGFAAACVHLHLDRALLVGVKD
jgi:SAM-dependent methyltransferase